MPAYFAYIRALNVGGTGVLSMAKLKQLLEKAGFKNVKTFIQSGNVSVDSSLRSNEAVAQKMEKVLSAFTKSKSEVFVRTREEIEALVKSNPFGKIVRNEKTNLYVIFLSETPSVKAPSPLKSYTKGKVDLVALKNKVAFVVSRKIGNEFGHPNFEKEYTLRATARNWNTILRMLK